MQWAVFLIIWWFTIIGVNANYKKDSISAVLLSSYVLMNLSDEWIYEYAHKQVHAALTRKQQDTL